MEVVDKVCVYVDCGCEVFDCFMLIDYVDYGLVLKIIGKIFYDFVWWLVFIGVVSIVGFLGVFLLWVVLVLLISVVIVSG